MSEISRETPLHRALEEQGRKSIWVAEQLGVSKSLVSLWCSGDRIPTASHRTQLAALLDLEEDELFPEEAPA